jgi:hypothetical protein
MFDNSTGNCREISTLFETFFYILVTGIYRTKTVKKCLQFVYIFADLLPVKFQTKFLILADTAINFLKNCLLNACMEIWQEFKVSTGFLKHITGTIGWIETPVLPNNCLTRIQASL